jgi:hypothetical protein
MKALLSIALGALYACGGRTADSTPRGGDAGIGSTSDAAASNDVGPISDDASAEGSSQSSLMGEDAAVETSAPQPPVNVTGLALWLDGEMGIATDGAGGLATWADRSGLGHVFLGEPSSGLPKQGHINGRGAVSFNGHNQVIIEQYPSPAQQVALNFHDSGFTLAIVFQQEGPIPAMPATIIAAQAPWDPCCSPPQTFRRLPALGRRARSA